MYFSNTHLPLSNTLCTLVCIIIQKTLSLLSFLYQHYPISIAVEIWNFWFILDFSLASSSTVNSTSEMFTTFVATFFFTELVLIPILIIEAT